MFDDKLKKFNEQMKDKDEQIIIPIVRGFIQQFVEDNYGRTLTEVELEELSWLVWEDGEQHVWDWLDKAVRKIIPSKEVLECLSTKLKNNHETKGSNHESK